MQPILYILARTIFEGKRFEETILPKYRFGLNRKVVIVTNIDKLRGLIKPRVVVLQKFIDTQTDNDWLKYLKQMNTEILMEDGKNG